MKTPNLPSAGKYFPPGVDVDSAIIQGKRAVFSFLAGAPNPLVFVGDANTLAAFARIGPWARPGDVVVDLGAVTRLDEALVERASASLPIGLTQLVAVGGGTINDLCKIIAAASGARLSLVATCASMNGWVSPNASIVRGGNKVSVPAIAPHDLLLVDELLREAPRELTAAGVADALCGFFSCRDWQLSAAADDASFDASIAACVVQSLAPLVASLEAHPLDASNVHAALVDALLAGGVSMAAAHSSAPASGAEHVIAHAIDLRELAHGAPPSLHGHAVAIGTLLVAALWEVLLDHPASPAPMQSRERRVQSLSAWLPTMRDAAPAIVDAKVTRELRRPDPLVILASTTRAAPLPTVARLRAWFTAVECPTHAAALHVDETFLRDALLCARDLRDRYTVLDLAYAIGVLPARIDEVIARSRLCA